VGISKQHILNALANEDFDDVEDCLQADCAQTARAAYIITRNIGDSSNSSIPVILPEHFLKKIVEQGLEDSPV
jgi:hypothetical protein